jgi:hypothetical protein
MHHGIGIPLRHAIKAYSLVQGVDENREGWQLQEALKEHQ